MAVYISLAQKMEFNPRCASLYVDLVLNNLLKQEICSVARYQTQVFRVLG